MRVLVLEGGRSLEHDVSLRSARTIVESLTRLGHEVSLMEIGMDGRIPPSLLEPDADIIYPVMHGHQGEDGIIQAVAECTGLAYVSEDVATSAIGMDKALQAAIFRDAGIQGARSCVLTRSEKIPDDLFDCPHYIVKMSGGGSSIGIVRCDRSHLEEALDEVFTYDERLLVQEEVTPLRELETLVVCDNRNMGIHVAGPVEILPSSPFYVYENKYCDSNRVVARAMLDLDEEMQERIRRTAIRAFRAVHGSLYMRIDFFLTPGRLLLNEINTIPGSTPTSHFIYLAEELGGLDALVQLLLDSALARHERRGGLRRSHG